jgi:hypothetical protein
MSTLNHGGASSMQERQCRNVDAGTSMQERRCRANVNAGRTSMQSEQRRTMTATVVSSTTTPAERLYPGTQQVQHVDDIFALDPIAFAYSLCTSEFPEITGSGLIGAAVLIAVALDRWTGPESDPMALLEQLRTAFATGTAGVDEFGGWITRPLL